MGEAVNMGSCRTEWLALPSMGSKSIVMSISGGMYALDDSTCTDVLDITTGEKLLTACMLSKLVFMRENCVLKFKSSLERTFRGSSDFCIGIMSGGPMARVDSLGFGSN
jgi:hypothetical protein